MRSPLSLDCSEGQRTANVIEGLVEGDVLETGSLAKVGQSNV